MFGTRSLVTVNYTTLALVVQLLILRLTSSLLISSVVVVLLMYRQLMHVVMDLLLLPTV